jgi:hypothetical protein
VGYSQNDSHDFYHDDPIEESSKTKSRFKFLTTGVLILGSIFYFQSTLAGNISLSSDTGIEFGQGVSQSVACSGNTNLTLTPSSTFTNVANAAGAHYLNSVTVSNIPDSCFGADFTISAYSDSEGTPLALFNSTSKSVVVNDNGGTFERGFGSTGMTVASGTGTFTATFTTPVAQSSNVFKLTIQSGAHTPYDINPSYAVGNRGPGGGIVYYVSATNFTSTGSTCNTTCKYLEVAPASWKSGTVADDLLYVWSTNTTLTTDQNITTASTQGTNGSEKFNWKIGQGFYNTSVMKVSGATSAAQAAVLAYAGTSTAGQWFIPSMNELNELCKYARGQSTGDPKVACFQGSNSTFKSTAYAGTDLGGFISSGYWSSSENDAGFAWRQGFGTGNQVILGKDITGYVRPIRAF